jgi:hypothetical protein
MTNLIKSKNYNKLFATPKCVDKKNGSPKPTPTPTFEPKKTDVAPIGTTTAY